MVVLTRPSFSTARRETPIPGSATLDKPLSRECLFYPNPSASLDTDWAVACVLRGRLAYRGSRRCIAQNPANPASNSQSKTELLSLSRKIDKTYTKFIFSSHLPYFNRGHSFSGQKIVFKRWVMVHRKITGRRPGRSFILPLRFANHFLLRLDYGAQTVTRKT
jgi:hypothetical protein